MKVSDSCFCSNLLKTSITTALFFNIIFYSTLLPAKEAAFDWTLLDILSPLILLLFADIVFYIGDYLGVCDIYWGVCDIYFPGCLFYLTKGFDFWIYTS